MSDEKRDKGRFVERPEGAAEPFNSESGRKAALQRWDGKKQRNQQALIETVAKKLEIESEDLTYEEALKLGLLGPLFIDAMVEGKTAAIKLALQLLGEMPEGADAKVIVDKRQVNFMSFQFTPPQARAYIEDQRAQGNESVASLVDSQMNWEAEDGEIITIKVPLDDSD